MVRKFFKKNCERDSQAPSFSFLFGLKNKPPLILTDHTHQWSSNTDLVTLIIISIAVICICSFSNVMYRAAPTDKDKFEHFSPKNVLPSVGNHWGFLCNKHYCMPTMSGFFYQRHRLFLSTIEICSPALCFS